jgi:hypothetical protein
MSFIAIVQTESTEEPGTWSQDVIDAVFAPFDLISGTCWLPGGLMLTQAMLAGVGCPFKVQMVVPTEFLSGIEMTTLLAANLLEISYFFRDDDGSIAALF